LFSDDDVVYTVSLAEVTMSEEIFKDEASCPSPTKRLGVDGTVEAGEG
jgi:hypothetical protein